MIKGVETNENSRFVDHTLATPWEEFINDLELSLKSLYTSINKNFSETRRREAQQAHREKKRLDHLTYVPTELLDGTPLKVDIDPDAPLSLAFSAEIAEEIQKDEMATPFPRAPDLDGLHFEVRYAGTVFLVEVVHALSCSSQPQYIIPDSTFLSATDGSNSIATFSKDEKYWAPEPQTMGTSLVPSAPASAPSSPTRLAPSQSSSILTLSPAHWPGPLLHVLSHSTMPAPSVLSSPLYSYVIRIHPRDSQAISDPGEHAAIFSAFSIALRSAGLSPLPLFLTLDSISYLDASSPLSSAQQDESFYINFLNNQRLDRQYYAMKIQPHLRLYEGSFLHSFPAISAVSSDTAFSLLPSTHPLLSFSRLSCFSQGQNFTYLLNTPEISLAYQQLSLLPFSSTSLSAVYRFRRTESSTYKRITSKHQLFYYEGVRKLFLKKLHLLGKHAALIEQYAPSKEEREPGRRDERLLPSSEWPFHSTIIHFYEHSLAKWLSLSERALTDGLRQYFSGEYTRLTKTLQDLGDDKRDPLGGCYALKEQESSAFGGYDLYKAVRRAEEGLLRHVCRPGQSHALSGDNQKVSAGLLALLQESSQVSSFPALSLSSLSVQLPFSEANPWAVLDSEAYSSLLPARLPHGEWKVGGQFESTATSSSAITNTALHSHWKSSVLQKLLSFFVLSSFTRSPSSALTLSALAEPEKLNFVPSEEIILEAVPLLSSSNLDYLRCFLLSSNRPHEPTEETTSSPLSCDLSSSITYDLKVIGLNLGLSNDTSSFSTNSPGPSSLTALSALFNRFLAALSDSEASKDSEAPLLNPAPPSTCSAFSLCHNSLWDDVEGLVVPSLQDSLPTQLLTMLKFSGKTKDIHPLRALPHTFRGQGDSEDLSVSFPLLRRLPLTSITHKLQLRFLEKSRSGKSASLKEGAKRLHGLLPTFISDIRAFVRKCLSPALFPQLLYLFDLIDEEQTGNCSVLRGEADDHESEISLPYYFQAFSGRLYEEFCVFYRITFEAVEGRRLTNILFVLSETERVAEDELLSVWRELLVEAFTLLIEEEEPLFFTKEQAAACRSSSHHEIPSSNHIRPLFTSFKEHEKAMSHLEALPLSLIIRDLLDETLDYFCTYMRDLEASLALPLSQLHYAEKEDKDETERDSFSTRPQEATESKSPMLTQILSQSLISVSSLLSPFFQDFFQQEETARSVLSDYKRAVLKHRVTSDKTFYTALAPSLYNPLAYEGGTDDSALWYPEAQLVKAVDRVITSLQAFDTFFSKCVQFLPFLGHIYGRCHLLSAACPFLSINTNTDLSLQEVFTRMLKQLTSSSSSETLSYHHNTANLYAPELAAVTRIALKELKFASSVPFSTSLSSKDKSARDTFSLDSAEFGVPHGKIFILQTPHIYKTLSISDAEKKKAESQNIEHAQSGSPVDTLVVKLDFDSPPASPMKPSSEPEEEANDAILLHPISASLEVYPSTVGLFKMTAITNGKVIRTIYETLEDS